MDDSLLKRDSKLKPSTLNKYKEEKLKKSDKKLDKMVQKRICIDEDLYYELQIEAFKNRMKINDYVKVIFCNRDSILNE